MFSIQTQNQVCFHLSQLTSALGATSRSHRPRKTVRASALSGKQLDGEVGVIYSDSFNEAIRNCTELSDKNLLKVKLNPDSQDKFSTWLTWRQLMNQLPTARLKHRKPWQVSYTSAETFFENNYGFSVRELTQTRFDRPAVSVSFPAKLYTSLLRNMFVGRPFVFDVQTRGFKTDRNSVAERQRNPSFLSRLRDSVGGQAGGSSSHREEALVMAQGQKLGSMHADTEAEKLRGLMSDERMTPEDQQRMKVAFAEGYIAGNGQRTPGRTMKWLKMIQQLLTIVLFLGIFVSLMGYAFSKSSSSASGSMFRIQLGNQTEVDPEEIHVTFDDVKGADEAKQELKDVVEFLKNPERFSLLGGKLPKGVLLVGPPGTGKTLLARAVAGEAGVPFFHAAGPEFDEILVGQGARRVRDLFKAAKDRAPCVIFIDEIDSVGAKRTNSVLHPYANQTINQLLSEMDGFHQNEGVIVLGATNRREDLDKALLRPGRFDVEVNVPTPDYTGRKEILDLYLARVQSRNIDVEMLARGTTGFTGADLESMVNQAALRAAIDGAEAVSMKYLENARDKVLMGPERKSRLPDEEANLITAYHEGGHAVVAFYTNDSHPLHKVTIIPRGPSLGHTAYIPEKERYHVTKSQLLAMMDTMMGGRAAEELVFGPEKITSGASSDLKQATSIATHMVKDWGMSEKVGLRTHDSTNKGLVNVNELSPATSDLIDLEIKRILSESYERAKAILKAHHKEHALLAEALIKYETLDADDIKAIMKGKEAVHTDIKPLATKLLMSSYDDDSIYEQVLIMVGFFMD